MYTFDDIKYNVTNNPILPETYKFCNSNCSILINSFFFNYFQRTKSGLIKNEIIDKTENIAVGT